MSDLAAELRPKLDALGAMLPLRVHETADYVELHAANSDGSSAAALTIQPSLMLLVNDVPALVAEIERLRGLVSEWRSIETAPKDGTKFDAWVPSRFGGHRMTDLSFGWRGKLRQDGELTKAELPRWPTHWMALPAPPSEGESR